MSIKSSVDYFVEYPIQFAMSRASKETTIADVPADVLELIFKSSGNERQGEVCRQFRAINLRLLYDQIHILWNTPGLSELLSKFEFVRPEKVTSQDKAVDFIKSTMERITCVYNKLNPFLMENRCFMCGPRNLISNPPMLLDFLQTADDWEKSTKAFGCGSPPSDPIWPNSPMSQDLLKSAEAFLFPSPY